MKEIHALRERAKELRCLYRIDAIVSDRGQTPAQAFMQTLEAIPDGWQHPSSTGARIDYLARHYVGPGFSSDGRSLSQPIHLFGVAVGRIDVSDTDPGTGDSAPDFLPEEHELLRRIAGRLGEYLEWKHTELLGTRTATAGEHWRWRQRFAEALADAVHPDRFGVAQLFLGGSTALGDAGPGSDIDLYVVFTGSDLQRRDLSAWLEGWSLCLAEVSLQQTGHPFPGGILNVKWLEEAPDLSRRPDLLELSLRSAPSDAETSADETHSARGASEAVQRLVASLAGPEPTPAGGAAAAASVAQGIGLLLKVLRITGDRSGPAEWKRCADELDTALARALAAFEADCSAFGRVLEARRRADERAVLEAWVEATECPLEIASVATTALVAFAPVASRIKAPLKLDQEAAVKLIGVGISISIANARGNLAAIRDAGEQRRMEREVEAVLQAARAATAPFALDVG